MKTMSASTGVRVLLAILVFALGIVAVNTAFPSLVSAAEVSVRTAQVLPPGSNTCSLLPVSGFTPYVYGGSLHAFEFTVSDSSYVAVAGSAGKTDIPFNQMTRRIDQSGSLRVHADIASTPIGGGLTVMVTMLSSRADTQTVCISIITAAIEPESDSQGTPASAPTPSAGGATAPAPKPSPAPTSASPVASPTTGKTAATGPATGMGTSAPITSAGSILKDMCSGGAAPRLWFILLALYALIVAGAVFGRSQLPVALRTQEWTAAAIVVPLLLLFGLWYFVENCRVSAYAPAIATVIALAGLALAFWERKDIQVINLPGAKT